MDAIVIAVGANEIGKRVREARDKMGLSMRQLGEASELAHTAIQKLEAGRERFEANTVVKVAGALDVSIDYLMTGQGPKRPVGSLKDALKAGSWSQGAIAEACEWSHKEKADPGLKAWIRRLTNLDVAIRAARAEYAQDAEEGTAMQPGKRTK